MAQQLARLGNWRLDYNLHTACEADVQIICQARAACPVEHGPVSDRRSHPSQPYLLTPSPCLVNTLSIPMSRPLFSGQRLTACVLCRFYRRTRWRSRPRRRERCCSAWWTAWASPTWPAPRRRCARCTARCSSTSWCGPPPPLLNPVLSPSHLVQFPVVWLQLRTLQHLKRPAPTKRPCWLLARPHVREAACHEPREVDELS